MSDLLDEPLLSATQLADHLGVPVSTIYEWRRTGRGPLGFMVGKHLRFRPAVVAAWLEEREAAEASG